MSAKAPSSPAMKPRLHPALDPIGDALDELAGAALVLDPELKIVLASAAAAKLLGFAIPLGAPAAKLLCGDAVERPVADALAARRPVSALIHRPGPAGAMITIAVRALPLGGDQHSGSLVLLAPADAGDAEDEVEFHGIATRDGAMKQVFKIITRVAEDEAPVLVRGETGVGKELVAQAIHRLSKRR